MTDNSTRYAIGTLIFFLTGPICWAAHFTLLYASQSSLCALDIGEAADGHNAMVLVIVVTGTVLLVGTVVAAALRAPAWHALLAAGPLPDESSSFLLGTMRFLAALSMLAMIYAAVTTLILPTCAQLR